MKTTLGIVLVACFCALVVGVSLATPTQYTLVTHQGNWNDNSSWDPIGHPVSGDTAIIPAGKKVNIRSDEHISELRLQWNETSGPGIARIRGDASLTLHGDSDEFDGEIRFETGAGEDPPELIITEHLTLKGTGGSIVGHIGGGTWSPGIIKDDGQGERLTIQTDPNGGGLAVQIEGAVEVKAGLVNNGLLTVSANGEKLSLTETAKSGNGLWFSDGGILSVDVAVSGSGQWWAHQQGGGCGVIEFNAACPDLTGFFLLTNCGTLDINANLSTTGDLDIWSPEGNFVEIRVAPGKTAEFSVPTP